MDRKEAGGKAGTRWGGGRCWFLCCDTLWWCGGVRLMVDVGRRRKSEYLA